MSIEFFMGKPHRDGEYVCYIQDRTQPEWMRPIILNRYDRQVVLPQVEQRIYERHFRVVGTVAGRPAGRSDAAHRAGI
jgi:hypothetical protein